MKWKKLGLIFDSSPLLKNARSHASLPLPLKIDNDIYRIYFSSRDEKNCSHINYIEINIRQPFDILSVSTEPVLSPGPMGFFDDHGVYPASLVTSGDTLYLYYIGWNPGKEAPMFYSSVGLAISEDGGKTFTRYSQAPLLARSVADPCLVSSPCVIKEDGIWRMWYVSGFKWTRENSLLQSHYHIKYAESKNGIDWLREGKVAIDLQNNETNIARPSVLKGTGYQMWYCYNHGNGYKIGYAISDCGLDWKRADNLIEFIDHPQSWDSEAMCYPAVFQHGDESYMFYNGNQYGRDGFGLAVLVK